MVRGKTLWCPHIWAAVKSPEIIHLKKWENYRSTVNGGIFQSIQCFKMLHLLVENSYGNMSDKMLG